jgi:Ser/Thr protein kinase RdoA (MazF antagonist)
VPIRGTNNDVHEVRTSEGLRLALRVHGPGYRTPEQTRLELRFLETLAASGLHVPLAAGPVVEVAGRHCSLLTWVDGEELRPGRGLGPARARLLGETLARIHEVGLSFDDGVLPCWDAAGLLRVEASPYRPGPVDDLLTADERAVFGRVAEEGARTFELLAQAGADQGLVHADYIPGNCRFRGRRVGVLDFDDAGRGFFLYDLAVLLDHFRRELARACLAGYRSVRPLPTELERHVPVLIAVRHAATCLWLAGRLRTGAEPVPVRRFLEIRTGEMRRRLRQAATASFSSSGA